VAEAQFLTADAVSRQSLQPPSQKVLKIGLPGVVWVDCRLAVELRTDHGIPTVFYGAVISSRY
jgi:hypothetical protein